MTGSSWLTCASDTSAYGCYQQASPSFASVFLLSALLFTEQQAIDMGKFTTGIYRCRLWISVGAYGLICLLVNILGLEYGSFLCDFGSVD